MGRPRKLGRLTAVRRPLPRLVYVSQAYYLLAYACLGHCAALLLMHWQYGGLAKSFVDSHKQRAQQHCMSLIAVAIEKITRLFWRADKQPNGVVDGVVDVEAAATTTVEGRQPSQ